MKRFQGILYAMLSSATFGMSPLFAVPVLRSGMNTASVLFYRMLFSALLMGLLLLIRRSSIKVTIKQFFTILGLSLFYTASSLFLLESYLYIPSGIATTIHFLYPVFVTMLMVGFFKEHLSRIMTIAVMMAVGGVWLLSMGGGGGSISLPGVGMVLITVVAYGSYIVGVNRSTLKNLPTTKLTFYAILFGLSVYIVRLNFCTELQVIPSAWLWADVLSLAILPTAVSLVCTALAIHYIGSTPTAILGALEPVTALFFGVLLFHEKLTPRLMMGILMIITAVTLIIIGKSLIKKMGMLLQMNKK